MAEKEGDYPNRFAVGTGTVGDWDQYYLLEAPSVEKKQEWLEALKDIMKGQFDLLKGWYCWVGGFFNYYCVLVCAH